ncbi:hypothetical protein ACJD0Z_04065 [Flavobacteriaceae bacterium M23B6Z8]
MKVTIPRMNIEATKLELIHRLLQTQKEGLLARLQQVFDQEEETAYELSESDKKLLDDRLARHQSDPQAGKDWKAVKKELLGE